MELGLYYGANVCLGLSFVGALWQYQEAHAKKLASVLLALAMFFLSVGLIYRALSYHRVPMASLFEFCLMLVLFVGVMTLVFGQSFKDKGSFLAISSGLLSVGLFLALQLEARPISLLPALQSPWFFSHIFSALIAYLAFSLSFFFALAFLLKKEERYFTFLEQSVYVGFFMQTLLLVTGSLWALDTWGRFWAWDPKEVWALLTYFCYGSFIHFSLIKWKKTHLAYLAIISFLVLLFTLVGVSLGLSGLHAY